MPRNAIFGVILAGGRSRRFGGGDKGLAELHGEPILAHVIRRFAPQVGRLVLNVNGDAERFARFGVPTIADRDEAELGPLSGVLAAMDWAREASPEASALATVSSDVPFLPLDVVQKLDAARGQGVAIASSAGRRHPTIALWPISARDGVAQALQRRALSVDRLALDLKAVAVDFPVRDIGGRTIDPFLNINTQDDLASARALASKAEG
jgi:molybdenum cofactor guanylyltransferase